MESKEEERKRRRRESRKNEPADRKEARLAYQRKYDAEHRDAKLAYWKKWVDENKEARRAHLQKSYQANRENIRRKVKESVVAKIADYKRKAEKKGRVFELTDCEAEELFRGNCFYCDAAPSPLNGIDRVDNDFGYIRINCVSACKTCNYMKRALSFGDFVRQCSMIVDHFDPEK